MASKDTYSASVPKEIEKANEFVDWYDNHMDGSYRSRVDAMEAAILENGAITNVKDLGNGLYEKKWNNGLRVYFSAVVKNGNKTLLIIGGNKNNQDSDIAEARKTLARHKVVSEVKKIK